MVFEWKTKGIFKDIDANIAGAELERIKSENGELTAAGIVNASRSKRSPLHSCFEWRDDIAAERYREQQARVLVANIIVKQVEGETEYPVRAFIHINGDYKPIETVIADVELTNSMLEMAKREMVAFRDKYKTLTELAGVFSAIESVCDDGQRERKKEKKQWYGRLSAC